MSKPDAPDYGAPFDILTSKVYRTDSFPGHPLVRVVFGSKMADGESTKNGVVPMVEIRDANTGEPLKDFGVSTLPETLGLIGDALDDLQKQIDRHVTTWFYDVPPSPQEGGGAPNLPASEWDTAQKKEEHVGDLYYDRVTGNGYRWVRSGDSEPYAYYWAVLQNDMALEALRAASKAQDTADNKRRIFYCTLSGSDKPAPPYDVGDLLVTPSSNGNLIYKCVTAKAQGQQYAASDWGVANDAGTTATNYMSFVEGIGLVLSEDASANGANALLAANRLALRYGLAERLVIEHDESTGHDMVMFGTGSSLVYDATTDSLTLNPKSLRMVYSATDKRPLMLSVRSQFYLSTSSASPTGGSWSDEQPAWTDGKFLWTRTVTVFSDAPGTDVVGEPVCITGNTGRSVSGYYRWYKVTQDGSEPSAPSGDPSTSSPESEGWTLAEPGYDPETDEGAAAWFADGTRFSSGSPLYSWSPVSLSSSYEAQRMQYLVRTEDDGVWSRRPAPVQVGSVAEVGKVIGSSVIWNQAVDREPSLGSLRIRGGTFRWNQLAYAPTAIPQDKPYGGWVISSATSSVSAGVVTYTTTARYGGPSFTYKRNGTIVALSGHVMFFEAEVKMDAIPASIPYALINDGISQTLENLESTTEWQRVAVAKPISTGATATYAKIQDPNTSGWATCHTKNWIFIDLTAIYGAGKEPATAEAFRATTEYRHMVLGRHGAVERDAGSIHGADGGAVRLNQHVVDGGFSDPSKWQAMNSTIVSLGDGEAVFDGLTSGSYVGVRNTPNWTDRIPSGHRMYVSAWFAPSDTARRLIMIANGASSAGYIVKNVSSTEYARFDGIFTAGADVSYITFGQQDLRAGHECRVKEPMAVDLTEIYGAGNEPVSAADFRASAEYAELVAGGHPQAMASGEYARNAIAVRTQSANVLPNRAESKTVNGISFSVAADGSVTATGTASADAALWLFGSDGSSFPMIPQARLSAGEYIYSDGYGGDGVTRSICGFYDGESSVRMISFGSDMHTVSLASGFTLTAACLTVKSGRTVSGIAMRPSLRQMPSYGLYAQHEESTARIPMQGLVLDGIGELSDELTVEADGSCSVGKRFGRIDMGALEWIRADGGYFYTSYSPAKKPSSSSVVANLLAPMYETVSAVAATSGTEGIAKSGTNENIVVRDSSCSTVAELKAKLNGAILCYELATPRTETLDAVPVPQLMPYATMMDAAAGAPCGMSARIEGHPLTDDASDGGSDALFRVGDADMECEAGRSYAIERDGEWELRRARFIGFRALKLEKGAEPTPWSPSPSDDGWVNMVPYTEPTQDNLAHWTSWTSASAKSVENGWFKASNSSAGASGARGMQSERIYDMDGGVTYTLSFDAYATAAMPLNYVHIMSDDGNTNISTGASAFQLTTSPQHYELTFSLPSAKRACGVLMGSNASAIAASGAAFLFRNVCLDRDRNLAEFSRDLSRRSESAKGNRYAGTNGGSVRMRSDGFAEVMSEDGSAWRGPSVHLGSMGLKVGETFSASCTVATSGEADIYAYLIEYDSSGARVYSAPMAHDGGSAQESNWKVLPKGASGDSVRVGTSIEWSQAAQDLIDSGGSIRMTFQNYAFPGNPPGGSTSSDTSEAYSKQVPATARKWASVDRMLGNTQVWNQIVDNGMFAYNPVASYITRTYQNKGGRIDFSAEAQSNSTGFYVTRANIEKYASHTLAVFADVKTSKSCIVKIANNQTIGTFDISANTIKKIGAIIPSYNSLYSVTFYINAMAAGMTSGDYLEEYNINIVDLTQMFGAGNEPTATSDPRIQLIREYAIAHPEYSEGELISAAVDDVVSRNGGAIIDTLTIPQNVRDLCPCYGMSAGNVRNELDLANKRYIQRVGAVDMGTLTWMAYNASSTPGLMYSDSLIGAIQYAPSNAIHAICGVYDSVTDTGHNSYDGQPNKSFRVRQTDGRIYVKDTDYTTAISFRPTIQGVMLCYELATPITVDLSGVLHDRFLQCEAGGSLTFEQVGDTEVRLLSDVTYYLGDSGTAYAENVLDLETSPKTRMLLEGMDAVCDATLCLGAGNEPSDADGWLSLFPYEGCPYSRPSVLDFRADRVSNGRFELAMPTGEWVLSNGGLRSDRIRSDEMAADGATVSVGAVDMGSLQWSEDAYGRLTAPLRGMLSTDRMTGILAYDYRCVSDGSDASPYAERVVYSEAGEPPLIVVHDSRVPRGEGRAERFAEDMGGVVANYSLADAEHAEFAGSMRMAYTAEPGDTERIIVHAQGEQPQTAPIHAIVDYVSSAGGGYFDSSDKLFAQSALALASADEMERRQASADDRMGQQDSRMQDMEDSMRGQGESIDELERRVSAQESESASIRGDLTAQSDLITQEALGRQADVNDLRARITGYVYNAAPSGRLLAGIYLGRIDGGDPDTILNYPHLHITDTQIEFVNEGNVAAYISSNKLYIPNAQVTNELLLGEVNESEPLSSANWDFWSRTDANGDGHLSLKWIGG